MNRTIPLVLFVLTCVSSTVLAQQPKKKPWDMLTARPKTVDAWQDMRFGVFLCWGPVTLTGLEIGWSRGAPRGGEFRVRKGQGPTPAEVYDNLYKKWKPEKFDARQWVRVAKDGGAKYLIFLVKHHDGFCLYDSKLTDYKTTGPQSAWKVDVMKQVADACHEADLKLIVYYSQPDWHHPDYRTKNHCRYIKYLHGQVRELLTNYGRIDGFWFDLGGKPEDWDTVKLFTMMRTLQPWLIINNRCGLPGDFDTPEQHVGRFQVNRPWESCCTLGTQWSWKPNDKIKSFNECIRMLVCCAVGDGNLALNTNPMPDGRIEPRQAERFRQIGRWLAKYGESIYGTRGGPFIAPDASLRAGATRDGFSLPAGRWWGGSTHQQQTVYLHVLRWPKDTLTLPDIGRKVVHCTVPTGGHATIHQTADGIQVTVPPEQRDKLDTIIKLEFDRSVKDVEPVGTGPKPLSAGCKAAASGVWPQPHLTADLAFDNNPVTRWGAQPGATSGWLAVDLGKPTMVRRAIILEGSFDRVRKFELQYQADGDWNTIVAGTSLGQYQELKFPPVEGRCFRLNILEATNVPTIYEVQLFQE